MAASTDLTPLPLFYTTGLSTSAAEIYSNSTSVRTIVTALYVVNRTTADATANVIHRLTSGGADVEVVPGATIEANQSILFGPLVLSSTTSAQSIRAYGGTASAIQLAGYGYTEVI